MEKKVGPMPTMWEAEMYHDEVDEDGSWRSGHVRDSEGKLCGEKIGGDDDRDWQDLIVRACQSSLT